MNLASSNRLGDSRVWWGRPAGLSRPRTASVVQMALFEIAGIAVRQYGLAVCCEATRAVFRERNCSTGTIDQTVRS